MPLILKSGALSPIRNAFMVSSSEPSRNILPERTRRFAVRSRRRYEPIFIDSAGFEQAEEIDSEHLLDQLRKRQVALGLIPGVNPVHHAKQGKGGDAQVNRLAA